MEWLKLAPGIDSIPCENGVLLKSDFLALRLEGASARMVADRIIPFLSDWQSMQSLCDQVFDYEPSEIQTLANDLVAQGVLIARNSEPPEEYSCSPWLGMLEALNVPFEVTVECLSNLRIGIFGLDAIGSGIAFHLAQMGVNSFTVIDPGRYLNANSAVLPFPMDLREEIPRQTAIANFLKKMRNNISVAEFDKEILKKEDVKDIIDSIGFAVGVFDRTFSAAHHWINNACLEAGIPALFCDLQATRAYVGPMVFPGETGCYMCWRMRHIATRDNFKEAMTYELAMDKAKDPGTSSRPVFPPLASWAASLASMEIIKVILGLSAPETANHILELNALDTSIENHIFLHRPDCPSCHGKLKAVIKDNAYGLAP